MIFEKTTIIKILFIFHIYDIILLCVKPRQQNEKMRTKLLLQMPIQKKTTTKARTTIYLILTKCHLRKESIFLRHGH